MTGNISPQISEIELTGVEGMLDAFQRREDSKWRGHVVHEAQTSMVFALKILFNGFVIGFGGLMAYHGRVWTGSAMMGIGTYMTHEEVKQYCGENKLAAATIYLAGGHQAITQVPVLRNWQVSQDEKLQFNPNEMTQPIMRLVDTNNKVIALAFKYLDPAYVVDNPQEKLELSVIKIFDFEKRFKPRSEIDLSNRLVTIVSTQLFAQEGREMEGLFVYNDQLKLRFAK